VREKAAEREKRREIFPPPRIRVGALKREKGRGTEREEREYKRERENMCESE